MDSNERIEDDEARVESGPDPAAAGAPVLLYDGLCGFCDRTVRFILARDPGGPLRFAPLQGRFAARVMAEHPHLREADSLVLVDDGGSADAAPRIRMRSDAAIAIGRYLGGSAGVLARVARLVPRPLRDAAYDLFARHRYRLFGRFDACPLPSADVRSRFLD